MSSSPPAPLFSDVYVVRQVAESASKPCSLCFKPTVWVLVEQSTKRDWMYVCKLHLRDRSFASPVEQERAEPKVAETVAKPTDAEIQEVTRLYNERKEREKNKDKQSNDDKVGDDAKEEGKDDDKKEKDKDDSKNKNTSGWLSNLASWTKGSGSTPSSPSPVATTPPPEPRIFKLHRDIYKMRLQKFRDRTRTNKTTQILRDPSMFPSVPKTDL